jgi:F420-0:gamma-glutamyl ligase-like protein
MASVLIYDGDCVYCSVASKALRRLGDVGAVTWEDDAAQRFLEAQFGEVPFAMFLVDTDEGVVYAGRSAAGELAERAGAPSLASDLVSSEYDGISKVVGIASRREREPDDYHGVYDLRERAEEDAGRLLEVAEVPEETV